MATSLWTGVLSFGLVTLPVKLFSATSSNNISFNLLHQECGGRINLQNYCPTCKRVVTRDELVKGYEHQKNEYVTVEDQELEKIKPQSSSNLDVVQFIHISEVDPIYFEKTYYLGADKGSEKTFALLIRAMKNTGRAAIGKMTMRNHEYLTLVRPDQKGTGLIVHFMLYKDEIRANEFGVQQEYSFREKEMELAEQLIENLTEPFDPGQFKDEYVERVEELLDSKISGRKLRIVKPKQKPQFDDLMEALQRSVEQTRKPMAMLDDKMKKKKKSAV